MDDSISTRPLYLKHTATDGKAHVAEHIVWDAAKFVDSQQREAAELNEKAKDPTQRKAKVEQITAEQYRAERA